MQKITQTSENSIFGFYLASSSAIESTDSE